MPKSLYMADDDIDTDESSFRVENVYHTAYVQKDYPHEVGWLPHSCLLITGSDSRLSSDPSFTTFPSFLPAQFFSWFFVHFHSFPCLSLEFLVIRTFCVFTL